MFDTLFLILNSSMDETSVSLIRYKVLGIALVISEKGPLGPFAQIAG